MIPASRWYRSYIETVVEVKGGLIAKIYYINGDLLLSSLYMFFIKSSVIIYMYFL